MPKVKQSDIVLYRNCEVLPLWNFFKIIEQNDLKYLIRLSDRFDYEGVKVVGQVDYTGIWDSIVDEYAGLENSAAVHRQNFNKAKLYFEWAQYTEERAMIQYLMLKTEPEYIKKLRERGYAINTDDNLKYWESLSVAAQRVHYHLTHLDLISKEINRDLKVDDAKDRNSYDIIMAWISANNIRVEEDITVKRYVAVKKIIVDRLKAQQQSMSKRRMVNGS